MKKLEEVREIQKNFHAVNSKYLSLKKRRKDLKQRQEDIYLPIIKLMNQAEKDAIKDSKVNEGVPSPNWSNPHRHVKPLASPPKHEYYPAFKIKKSNFQNGFLRLHYRFEESCGCGEYDKIYERVKIPLSYFDMTEEQITKAHYEWFMGICIKILTKRKAKQKEEKLKKEAEALERRKAQYQKLKQEFES